ncbi:melanocortin receptor 5-like [Orbicella faveolata]|uniref:melanocortin receptor 5-like n=1 Tax=Orbicella faveolata TaxID=48498 RepID=UPI0009E32D04|nr:melanocortin receptor 5-like [Orbicella faveolata]
MTGDGNFTSKLNQVLSTSPASALPVLTALNIFLSMTASLSNALVLIALHKVSSIHLQTKLFFRCLAVTDLCVGLIVQPLDVTYYLSPLTKMYLRTVNYVYEAWSSSSMILCGVSTFTLAAISVDRFFALLLGLRYRHVVTLRRVRVVILCFWLIGASGAVVWVWREDTVRREIFAVVILSVLTSIFSYTWIHLKLRHQQTQVQNHFLRGQTNGRRTPLSMARYKKSASSTLWVQLALAACYIPLTIVAVLGVNERTEVVHNVYVNGIEYDIAWSTASSLVHLNSSLNSILYCWKIREVRQHMKDTIKQQCRSTYGRKN